MTSSDGVVWESAEGIGSNQWLTVEWSPALGVFMAASFAAGPDQTMYSADGKTWTLQSTNTGARWWGLSWSPELGIFVAVGVSTPAGVHGIMTSSVACPTGTVWQTEGCVPPPCANGLEWLDNCLADACPAGYLWGNGTCEVCYATCSAVVLSLPSSWVVTAVPSLVACVHFCCGWCDVSLTPPSPLSTAYGPFLASLVPVLVPQPEHWATCCHE